MRKQIVIALFATALLTIAGVTQAKDSDRGHRSNHSRGHSSGHHQSKHFRNHNRRGKHYYGGAYRHHGYRPYSYGHRGYRPYGYGHHGYSNGLGYVAGALVVGSLIHSINHRQPSQIVYRSKPVSRAQDYWYRVDSDGQCVEVRMNRDGQEVWTYVDASYCR